MSACKVKGSPASVAIAAVSVRKVKGNYTSIVLWCGCDHQYDLKAREFVGDVRHRGLQR